MSAEAQSRVAVSQSPKIVSHSWGRLVVEGEGGQVEYKDAKLFPGGSRRWDWRETGTEHSPGVQVADAQELLEHGARVIVLSQGVLGRLQVPRQTVAALEARGVRVFVLRTAEAVELYNRLRQTEAVGALIHTTC